MNNVRKNFKQGDRIVLNAEVPRFSNGNLSAAMVKRGDEGVFIRYTDNYKDAVVSWGAHLGDKQYYIDVELISALEPEPKETYTINVKEKIVTFDTLSEAKAIAKILKELGVKYTVTKNVISSEEIDI